MNNERCLLEEWQKRLWMQKDGGQNWKSRRWRAMRDYEELVKALRSEADGFLMADAPDVLMADSLNDVADAIEELALVCRTQKAEFDAYIDKTPKWISVEERFPEEGKQILCKCRAGIYAVMKWDGADWYENPTHMYMSGFVTHWMPMPEPPKEDADA